MFGVFLLARAARVKQRREVSEWIDAARSPRTFLASVVDLTRPVDDLFKLGLARSTGGGIAVDPRLLRLSHVPDQATLHDIARILLASDPPFWLRVAVTSAGVAREYIPNEDLIAINWLGSGLDGVLLGARADLTVSAQEPLRKAIGEAAELFVLAALARAGAKPVHVARFSDSFGYDIETKEPALNRIKVKAAGVTSRGSFHLTRLEFDTSQLHKSEWRLLQVVFSSSAVVTDELDSSHVEGIFELSSEALSMLVPPDSPHFSWNESILITPPPSAWRPTHLKMDTNFTVAGFRETPSYLESRALEEERKSSEHRPKGRAARPPGT